MVASQYPSWLYSLIDTGQNFHMLCNVLDSIPYRYSHTLDFNREHDGHMLRYKFGIQNGYSMEQIDEARECACSVLEMMVALAQRMEDILFDPDYGNRTGVWFNEMLYSLGILPYTDDNFGGAEEDIRDRIEHWLSMRYNEGTYGGLFYIRNAPKDTRAYEIWMQANMWIREFNERGRKK